MMWYDLRLVKLTSFMNIFIHLYVIKWMNKKIDIFFIYIYIKLAIEIRNFSSGFYDSIPQNRYLYSFRINTEF